MKLLAGSLASLMLVGCTTTSHPTAAVSSPSASASAAPSPDLPVTTVDFSCTLPVVIQGEPPYGWSGGFITFPAATYRSDPAGVIRNIGDGELQTEASPVLLGYALGAPFYDLAARRWLPAGSEQASPDGSSYAFASPPFGGPDEPISVVNVATGATHTTNVTLPQSGMGQAWQLTDYDGTYVYLVASQIDQFPRGVWRLNPATGGMQQMLPTSAGHVLLVQSGVAWLGEINPADPSPPNPPKGEAFDTIASVNLATGAQTTWIYTPQISVALVGVDESGRPVVRSAFGPDFDTTHGTMAVLPEPGGWIGMGTQMTVFAMQPDLGRFWFGNDRGIYIWTQATGFNKVYAFAGDPTLGQAMMPAGRCV